MYKRWCSSWRDHPGKADEVLNLYDELYEQYNKRLGPGPAQSKRGLTLRLREKTSYGARAQNDAPGTNYKQITLDLENTGQ